MKGYTLAAAISLISPRGAFLKTLGTLVDKEGGSAPCALRRPRPKALAAFVNPTSLNKGILTNAHISHAGRELGAPLRALVVQSERIAARAHCTISRGGAVAFGARGVTS